MKDNIILEAISKIRTREKENMTKPNDPALAVLNKVRAGFWPSDKELEEAAAYLGKQERRIEELQAVMNPFAKIGAKIDTPLNIGLIEHGNLQVTYADLVRAADVLYGKDRSAPEAETE